MPRRRKPGPPPASLVATGQPYGQAGEQQEVLAATKDNLAMQQARRPDPARTLAAATVFQPPPMTPLSAPSERPGEAVTSGLPIGAGAGPESVPGMATSNNALDTLRAVFMQYPSESIRELIEDMEAEG